MTETGGPGGCGNRCCQAEGCLCLNICRWKTGFFRLQEYYQAITHSPGEAGGRAFIDFMLPVIYGSLKEKQFADVLKKRDDVGINEQKILMLLRNNERMSMKDLAGALNLSLRQTERLIASLKRKGFIRRIGPNKTGRWEVC